MGDTGCSLDADWLETEPARTNSLRSRLRYSSRIKKLQDLGEPPPAILRIGYDPGMALRKISSKDLATLRWIDIPAGDLKRVAWEGTDTVTRWWRIVAEISCSLCDAYQAADSDPTNDKQVATTLALALFDDVGWRVDERNRTVCGDCVLRNGVDC